MTVTVVGCLISISLGFYILYLRFFLSLVSVEKICQIVKTLFDHSKFVKNTPLRVVFSTLFSVFGNLVKHGLSCLIYYWKT